MTENIVVTLGYENPSLNPDINAVLSRRSYVGDINDPDDIEASKQLELLDPDFDQNNDGFKHFLQLIDGETFTQTIDITNNGSSGTFTFDVDVTNSQFSRLTDLEIADDMGGIFLPGETVQGLEVDVDLQTATITAHIGHGETLKLNAVSTIDAGGFNENPDDDLDVRELDFSLIDAPGVDFGTGDADGLVYLDPGGFSRFDGIKEGSGFEFDALADSTLSVNFNGEEVSQETETLRGYAEYSGTDTTANDEGSLDRQKTFFFSDYSGDVDTDWESSPTKTRSDELSLNDELTLLWLNRPDLQEAIDQYRFNPSDLSAYNQLLDLIDVGIGDEVLSTLELDGRVAQFIRSGGLNGEGGFTQPALSGDLGDGVPTPGVPEPPDDSDCILFESADGDGFEDFIAENVVDPDETFCVEITEATEVVLTDFAGGNITEIFVAEGQDFLNINSGNGNANLDFSNTEIFNFDGSTLLGINANLGNGRDTAIGTPGDDIINGGNGRDNLTGGSGNDTITGGNGRDNLTGGLGDDNLTGGRGKDTFVLVAGDGTDTITDFSNNDLIGLTGGLNFGDLSFSSSDILSGGETLATLDGVDTTTLTESDFTII